MRERCCLVGSAPISRCRHNRTGEDNGDAHLDREVVVPVIDGQLDIGPWEQISYGDFDGCRQKSVLVKIIGKKKTAWPGGPRVATPPRFAGNTQS